MDPKEFRNYAVKHRGMNSMHLEKYAKSVSHDVTNLTPYIIEERQLNVAQILMLPDG